MKHNNNQHVAYARAGYRWEAQDSRKQAVSFDWPKQKTYKAFPMKAQVMLGAIENRWLQVFGGKRKFQMPNFISPINR